MESWKVEDTVRLAEVLAGMGVDLLDVSSGGLHPKQRVKSGPGTYMSEFRNSTNPFYTKKTKKKTSSLTSTSTGYQAPFAKAVKAKLRDRLAVGTVGTITSGKQAQQLLDDDEEDGGLDLAIVGRMFQKNPGLVWTFAEELGVQVNVANQIRWGFGGRPGAAKKKEGKM